jgi:growth arrest-specific protein 8
MGPKSKKSKGKKDDAEAVDLTNGDQSEFALLKATADRLTVSTEKEDHDFNEFQQQREKLNYFWIVEKKKLEDKRAELRNKERELQDLEEKHQVEIKIYKQRLKHLLQEHQNEITHKKTESEIALKISQDDDREIESEMKEDKRNLNIELKEIELSHEEFIRGLKREQDQKITILRHEFERKANETQKMYESHMKKTRETLDRVRKEEIKSIEEAKHLMIDNLMNEHQRAFADIKNYYNDITHNNLDLIKSLKEEVKELELDERKDELRLHEKMTENKKLSLPLKKMQDDVIRLRSELTNYLSEKNEMKIVKSQLEVVEEESRNIHWEYEVLLQRNNELIIERDELKSYFMSSIYSVKQKCGLKSLLFEKKLLAMQRIQEEKEGHLNEVMARANIQTTSPSGGSGGGGSEENILFHKNEEIRRLTSEVARIKSLQQQLQLSVATKMKEYGLAVDELGFVPQAASSHLTETQHPHHQIN